MQKNYLILVLVLFASTLSLAKTIELQSDKSVSAEVSENKTEQIVTVSLKFLPVTTLDSVSNEEMTEVISKFLTEEALSIYFKSTKMINFSKVKLTVHSKSEKSWHISYHIPDSSIKNWKEEEHTVSAAEMKKHLSSLSAEEVIQNFRSSCFRDLRIAEAVFLDKIKNGKDKGVLDGQIKQAFDALLSKINADDALFLSEKEELEEKAKTVRKFLIKKMNTTFLQTKKEAIQDNKSSMITNVKILPEYRECILSSSVLLELGGCQAFQQADGRILLVAVGYAEVNSQTPQDRIRRQRIAEQKAFGELAKYQEVEVMVFASRDKATTITTKNGLESSESKRTSNSRITIRAGAYFNDMLTIGQWYSKNEKLFYLAKGCIIQNEGKK